MILSLFKDRAILSFIFKWIVFWLMSMGFYSLILREHLGFSYQANPALTSIYFVFLGLIGSLVLSGNRLNEYFLPRKKEIFLIFISFFIFILLPSFINLYFPLDDEMRKKIIEWKFMFPLFEFATSFSKLGDIIFQQSLILSLVLFLQEKYKDKTQAILVFSFIFFVLHIPLFIVFDFSVALIFIIPSLIAGWSFSYSILSFTKGFLISISMHQLFYILIGAIFRF